MPIRVVLAEDNYLVREGVRQLIDAPPELQVVAVCTDFDSLLAAVEQHKPDVVLTDIRMPPTGTDEGIRAAERLDPKVIEGLVAAKVRKAQSPLADLTPREHEVLALMAQGKNNAAIAATLFLTERAVEKHINSIFSKLSLAEEKDTHRRVRAALLYLSESKA